MKLISLKHITPSKIKRKKKIFHSNLEIIKSGGFILAINISERQCNLLCQYANNNLYRISTDQFSIERNSANVSD